MLSPPLPPSGLPLATPPCQAAIARSNYVPSLFTARILLLLLRALGENKGNLFYPSVPLNKPEIFCHTTPGVVNYLEYSLVNLIITFLNPQH